MKKISTIVIGSLNADIIGLGINNFPKPGGYTRGREIKIGPGGKSRNIAQMIAILTGKDTVAMIGRTTKDKYGLWKPPLEALQRAGIDVSSIRVLNQPDKLPGIALIPINKDGTNQIYFFPGVSEDFSAADIDMAASLFKTTSQNRGMLALTMECPVPTAKHAIAKAHSLGIKVSLDPGGMQTAAQIKPLLNNKLAIFKPNEHEAEIITGVRVKNLASAKRAATKLLKFGIKNVLITAGKRGAYLFNSETAQHISIPKVKTAKTQDETGCGDQTMAALCAYLQNGDDLVAATRKAILAGTLQFHKLGIQPITKTEIARYI